MTTTMKTTIRTAALAAVALTISLSAHAQVTSPGTRGHELGSGVRPPRLAPIEQAGGAVAVPDVPVASICSSSLLDVLVPQGPSASRNRMLQLIRAEQSRRCGGTSGGRSSRPRLEADPGSDGGIH